MFIELYQHDDQNPVEEVSDNTLFMDRSGIPSQDEESEPSGEPEPASSSATCRITVSLQSSVILVMTIIITMWGPRMNDGGGVM